MIGKRWQLFIIIIEVIAIIAWFAVFAVKVVYASTEYESYHGSDDTYGAFTTTVWRSQTFTPSTSHEIEYVVLLMNKASGSSPGTATCEIYATSGGNPTGGALTSGTTNCNNLPNSPATEWRTITLSSTASLTSGTQYAIVMRNTNGQAYWRIDSTSPTYGGGLALRSTDSGSTWTQYPTVDYNFEEWGYETPSEPPEGVTSFLLTRNGDDSVTANWTLSDTAEGVRLIRDWSGYPGVSDPFVIYQGDLLSWTDNCGLPMFLTWHYSIFEYNDGGWSGGVYDEIGGDDMNVEISFPIGMVLLGLGIVLTLANFFFKSPLVYLALVAVWFGVFFSPDLANTWLQWVSIPMIFWAGLGFFYRLSNAHDKGGY